MWRKYGIGVLSAKELINKRILRGQLTSLGQKTGIASKIKLLRLAVIRPALRTPSGFVAIIAAVAVCAASLLPLDALAMSRPGKIPHALQAPAILASETAASKTYCSLMLALHFPQTGCQSMVAAAAPPDTAAAKTAAAESGVSGSTSGQEKVPSAAKEQRPAQTLLGIIPFMNNSSVLTSNVTLTLDKLSMDIGKSSGTRLLILGHANRTGSEDYGRELSRQRAEAVAKYLAGRLKFTDPKNIVVEARGTTSPLPAFDPADGNQRRVEIYKAR